MSKFQKNLTILILRLWCHQYYTSCLKIMFKSKWTINPTIMPFLANFLILHKKAKITMIVPNRNPSKNPQMKSTHVPLYASNKFD